jgi:hypothetical protein
MTKDSELNGSKHSPNLVCKVSYAKPKFTDAKHNRKLTIRQDAKVSSKVKYVHVFFSNAFFAPNLKLSGITNVDLDAIGQQLIKFSISFT